MFSIINHYGNAIKTEWETTSYPLEWLLLKKIINIVKNVEKWKAHALFSGNVKWWSCYGNVMEIPRKLNTGLPWWASDWESACQCRGHGFNPWSRKSPHSVEQLSPCATTTEPALYSPQATPTKTHMPRAHALQQEKPTQWEAPACCN